MTGCGQGMVVDASCVCVCVLPGLRGLLFTISLFWHGVWPSLRKPSFFKGYACFMVCADLCCQEIFSYSNNILKLS